MLQTIECLTGSQDFACRLCLWIERDGEIMPGSRLLKRLLNDRRGVTIIEYGLILGVAALIILAAARLLGGEAIDNFEALSDSVDGAEQTAEEGSSGSD